MRKIKFRAWDKIRKFMITIFDSTTADEWFIPNVKEDYEVMQFTGIKDKNGVEIYEGDIVIDKIGNPLPMVVKWDDEGFRTFGKYNGENYVGYVGHADRYGNNTCTVIGNIYENKELLNE